MGGGTMRGAMALAITMATACAAATAAPGGRHAERVCSDPPPGMASCHAQVVVADGTSPNGAPAPIGRTPSELQTAYGVSAQAAAAGAGRTIAIVDAYDDPTAAQDLAVYRAQFGLPPADCQPGHPCFTKVKQTKGRRTPPFNAGWALEESLDLDMASAICPNCNIVLVEALDNTWSNLLWAEDYATSHADVVSNSWGAQEFGSERTFESHFAKAPVAITASTGDDGWKTSYPAASAFVTAVGGTTLPAPGAETAWSGAGSACSPYIPRPAWQPLTLTGCATRAYADVSADADPLTGAAVYDSNPLEDGSSGGWVQVGGTSESAPIIAAVYALAGNTGRGTSMGYGYPYTHGDATNLHDVIAGSNGSCGAPICDAGLGWDGPTGLGTPNGTGAF